MSFLSEEEYENMWDTAREYGDVLEGLQEVGRVSAEKVHEELEYDEGIDEAIDGLLDVGLIEERVRSDRHGLSFSYRVTSLGREIIGHSDKDGYLGGMDEREDEFRRVYSSDKNE